MSEVEVFEGCIVIVVVGLVREREEVVIEKGAWFEVGMEDYRIGMLK